MADVAGSRVKRQVATKARGKARAYIALGANLGDPPAQLQAALRSLRSAPALEVIAVSQFYRTPPLGPPGQPDYCNAVCVVDTALEPETLLDLLQGIENAAGRKRDGERWGPRLLDLDLLHMEGRVSETPRLTLPHPQLQRRAFVLVPLAQVAPELAIPGLGPIATLAAAVDRSGVVPWH
ncbi:MAG: 2-amino-4-hydroxy-6-hydroxymethyldihydropteridine pyrophosphokinae [Nevskia sp.]|nr:2-amino-4-hydroxy-6-hydroxymethyldihydropteridine pyrophosphokinae [Nevskia sp.]